MPRWRKLHVKAVESLDINDMPDDFTRLLWLLLPLALDREGRGLDNAAWVKSKTMPLRLDVTLPMLDVALDWYETRGMIERYEVGGRRYFWAPSFSRYQGNTTKEAASEYPPPELVQSKSGASPELVQSESSTDSDSDADTDADAESSSEPGDDDDDDAARETASLPDPEQERVGEIFRRWFDQFGHVGSQVHTDMVTDLIERYGSEPVLAGLIKCVKNGARAPAYLEKVLAAGNGNGQGARASPGLPNSVPAGIDWMAYATEVQEATEGE